MTPTTNAKTAALEALIEAHAIDLKLPTVRRRFRHLAEEATREQQTPVAYLGALLEAEMAERAERRERRRLIDARFPAIKRLEDFRFADNPKVPQATLAALAEGSWIDDRDSVILIGDSGTARRISQRPGGLRLPGRTTRQVHHARRARQRTPRSRRPPRARPRRRALRPHRACRPR
jgi:IstB-like ATP binding protein